MKCFNHPEVDAVGSCKSCMKGLCPTCAKDLGHGLACKDKHEEDVEFLHTLIEASKMSESDIPKATALSNILYLLLGIAFLIWGWFVPSYGIMSMGGIFIIFWLALAIYNSNYFKKIGIKS